MHDNGRPVAPGPGGERRSGDRAATVFRPVLIETDQFAGFCLVRNLSSSGMSGRVYTSFAEGLEITVQFNPDMIVHGSLIWCRDGHVGIQFDRSLNVELVLSDLARKLIEGKINRAPRLQIRCKGELVIGDRTLVIEVQDISQRGIKAAASFIRPGDEVQVRLEGLERKAIVRWTQDGTAGLNFYRPLAFNELAHWVIERQAPETREEGQGSAPFRRWPARTDLLTGARNRHAFFELAQPAIDDQRWRLLVLADLNGLKEVNDVQGHAASDACLQADGAAVRKTIRRDDIFARLGEG